jgi:hypothetical protein
MRSRPTPGPWQDELLRKTIQKVGERRWYARAHFGSVGRRVRLDRVITRGEPGRAAGEHQVDELPLPLATMDLIGNLGQGRAAIAFSLRSTFSKS